MIVGVDPGASGAIATLDDDGGLAAVHDMPHLDGRVSAPHLAALLAEIGDTGPTRAWVEQAQSMPHQGVASSFRYGMGYGVILGVLGAQRVPTHHVRPATWKRALSLGKDKTASRMRAVELWPHCAHLFARVKDDGRAEAALIAWYGWRELART